MAKKNYDVGQYAYRPRNDLQLNHASKETGVAADLIERVRELMWQGLAPSKIDSILMRREGWTHDLVVSMWMVFRGIL